MKKLNWLLCVMLFTLICTNSFAMSESYHSVSARDGVQQPFWLIEPDNATHIVILFAGGKGALNITESGIGTVSNFLVRTRKQFADKGMVVAVVDNPSDKEKMFRFRKSKKHAKDIKAVMAYLKEHYPGKPLWLVGTSRGTISAANVAARIHGNNGPDGIVLTSSVTKKSNKGFDSLEDIDLSAITVPTYIVHHKDDECNVTPYNLAEGLLAKLSSVTVKEFKGFSGGNTKGNVCRGKSYHGYMGIEKQVVQSIVDWIKAH